MNKAPVFALALLTIVAMAWLGGCTTPGSPETSGVDIDQIINRDEDPDLNDDFGGFNMKDEAPAFGDAELLADIGEEQDYDDPMADLSDIRKMEAADRAQLFLMITWGNLHRDATIDGFTDWSGALTVDPGAILLKRTIRFEPNDHILPRTQRDLLEWESTTGPGFDGILVKIHAMPSLSTSAVADTVDSASVEIEFKTGPLSVAFTLDQLPNLNRVITLDDGNAVAFTAVHVVPRSCPHGLMRGVWRNDPERRGGVFYGRWATADGQVKGFMKGIYGVNDAGRKVFYGKMIDENGRFEGIMRGEWDNRTDSYGGRFAGRWVDRNLQIRGSLGGEWRRSDRCHGGFYRARWAMHCTNGYGQL